MECLICGSEIIIKDGKQKIKDAQGNILENIQRYRCTVCGKRFNKKRTENVFNNKEHFTNKLIEYLFEMDELDSGAQNKNIQINSKNLTKKVSERVSDDSSNHSSQFKFHKIKDEQMNIIEFQESSLKVRKYLISEYDESEDDFMILMKNGSNIYFVNNYIGKDGCIEMMIDTPNFSIQIRRRQNDQEYPDLEGKAIREKMQRQERKRTHKNENKNGSDPYLFYNKSPY